MIINIINYILININLSNFKDTKVILILFKQILNKNLIIL